MDESSDGITLEVLRDIIWRADSEPSESEKTIGELLDRYLQEQESKPPDASVLVVTLRGMAEKEFSLFRSFFDTLGMPGIFSGIVVGSAATPAGPITVRMVLDADENAIRSAQELVRSAILTILREKKREICFE